MTSSGSGPDHDAIEAWLEIGVPRERIVECPRSENFWQAGPTGPCGPCSELYLDRGLEFGKADDLPGGDNERFLEYWNLVFMQFDQNPVNTLTPLPAKNIDTGLGLNRLASILQGKRSIFETDQFWPLIELGEEMSGRRYGQDYPTDRALRLLADHSRAMSFLIADGVVPSNEDRGYVLRRIMRRAIQQGRALELRPGFLRVYADRVTEIMGSEYLELDQQRESIQKWLEAEEEGFGRTLEQGLKRLDDLIEQARRTGAEGIAASDAFLLHDTYGFPIDLTIELVAEQDLGVDEQGFEALMDEQRDRARASAGRTVAGEALRERALALADDAGFATDFVGYETTDSETTIGAVERDNGRVLVKLVESPFYATGGGQVADSGYVECLQGDCRARVEDVVRLGGDQIIAVVPERGTIEVGERVHAHVDRAARHATECNHTATHLLHAALRRRLGNHVRQAGSYVGPRQAALRLHAWQGADPRRAHRHRGPGEPLDPRESARARSHNDAGGGEAARRDGAVRREVRRRGPDGRGRRRRCWGWGAGYHSRELCGGTHVHNTAEIGLFKIVSEGSSAANMRRIEALTGPAGVELMRRHDRALSEAGRVLRVPPETVADAAAELRGRVRELEREARQGATQDAVDVDQLAARAVELDGALLVVTEVQALDGKALLDVADRLKNKLGDAAIVLGSTGENRVDLVASVAPGLVARGVKAGEIVKLAAAEVGGGGGGRDTLARAGGRDPSGLPRAFEVARAAIASALGE